MRRPDINTGRAILIDQKGFKLEKEITLPPEKMIRFTSVKRAVSPLSQKAEEFPIGKTIHELHFFLVEQVDGIFIYEER